MKQRAIEYFKTNKWWIFVFLLFIVADTALTMYILSHCYGMEANPFAGDKVFDWSFHFWRIDTVLIAIPLISIMKWGFAQNWLLQGITVGYGWTVLNGITMALFQVDIGIFQFLPLWAYYFGVLFQFAVGIVLLWVYRRLFGGIRNNG